MRIQVEECTGFSAKEQEVGQAVIARQRIVNSLMSRYVPRNVHETSGSKLSFLLATFFPLFFSDLLLLLLPLLLLLLGPR
jgi:hypothetical protein